MDSPNKTENRNSGSHASIASACLNWNPIALKNPIPTPFWNTRVTAPYAAPTDSRFMMIAFSGSTTDRNTTVNRMKDNPSTNASTIHWYLFATSRKSVKNAVLPPTSTVVPGASLNACGTIVPRRSRIAWKEQLPDGSNLRYASTSIAVPSLLVVTIVAGENRGSCAISCLRVAMALWVALLETSPVTTILAGSV